MQELEESVERLTAQVRERESTAVQARADREAACAASRQQVRSTVVRARRSCDDVSSLLRHCGALCLHAAVTRLQHPVLHPTCYA